MAWRNLWRNTRRTVVTCLAIGLGLAAMVFVTGWARGINSHIINAATRSGMGMAQIHAQGYLATGDVEIFMRDYRPVLEAAQKRAGIKAASPRVLGEGLLSIGGRSSYLRLTGILPELEGKVTDWPERMAEGAFLKGPGTIVLGQGLARNLEVEVGSKLVLTVADIFTGEMKYRLVRVAGVISSENPQMDKRSAIMNLGELAEDMGLSQGAHEIALLLDADPRDRGALVDILAGLHAPGLEVSEWQAISPLLARMSDIQAFFMSIVLGVVFFLISFGIVNTMSMALLERFREFGIMRALGTSPGRLSALIIAEAAWLGVVGCSGGLAIGLSLVYYLSVHGIFLGGVEVMNMAFKTPIYPVFHWPSIALVTLAFLVLTPIASLAVAFRAARVNPIEALRSE